MTRTARRWLLVAMVALFAAWLVAPATTPIYDGVGTVDEPYRYVHPPAGYQQTKAPTTARQPVTVSGGRNLAQYALSAENSPQVAIYVPAGAVQVPAGTSSMLLTATPIAAKAPLPSDGTIDGNVYHVEVTANGKPVTVVGTGNHRPTVAMRATSMNQPGPVFEYRVGNHWVHADKTIRTGNDTYQSSPVPVLGDFALVRLTKPEGSTGGGGGGVNWGLLAAGIAVLALAVVILVVRTRRTASGSSTSAP